jgi:hypothetical protein
MSHQFDFSSLAFEDRQTFLNFVGELRDPDLVIAPDGNPYLYRWHITPAKSKANLYLHIQTADDPERPLHDHPWDNTSVILAGGYEEHIYEGVGRPNPLNTRTFIRAPGEMIHRKAAWSHRLLMLEDTPYAMTVFVTGPKLRDWGFWYEDKWRLWSDVTRFEGTKSVHVRAGGM